MNKVLKIPIARLGAWHHPQYGVVKFTDEDFNSIVDNFKENVRGYEPPLRYGHHEKGPGIHDGERALGHMTDVYKNGDVLWGVFQPNDNTVIDELEKGQYRYATAEIIRNATDKFSGKKLGPFLKSHALTNTPFIPNLPRNIVESLDSLAEVLSDGGEVTYILSDLSETRYQTMMACECCGQPCDTCDEQGYCETCQQKESSEHSEESYEAPESPEVSVGLLRKLSEFMKGISQEVGALEKKIYDALEQSKPETETKESDNEEESPLMQKLAQQIENLISKLDKFMSGEDKAEAYSDSDQIPASPAEEAEVAPEPTAEAETLEVVAEEVTEQSEQEPDAASITEEDLQVKEELEKLQAEMAQLAAEKAELEAAKAAAEEAAKVALAELEAKQAEAAEAEAARAEEQFAQMLSDRVNNLVANGVAPVKANKAADLVRSLKNSVTAVVLSEGAEPVNVADAVFELLSDVQDVSFDQDGVAGLPGDAVEENPYKAQIERLRAKRAGQ